MHHVQTGLERLMVDKNLQDSCKGQIALLCHNASVNRDFDFAPAILKKIFGKRLIKLFGPQHGLVTDVQDNMIESHHAHHPYYDLPVYSLYSETRIPTDEMLEGIDTFIVDLQDVGTRVYTYISTLALLMKKVEGTKIKIVVLDRPNPVRGDIVEGNLLEENWRSFVGEIAGMPMRHAMTMGEVALYVKKYFTPDVELQVISMNGWKRDMEFVQTGLPWVLPSPNLPTPEGAFTFVGTVLYEGTNISEGRGTTRSLEVLGHPALAADFFIDSLRPRLEETGLKGFALRAVMIHPMFQKHAGKTIGGVFIHPTDTKEFRPWALGQVLMRELKLALKEEFQWNDRPYEYETKNLAIDYINGSEKIRQWVEGYGSWAQLKELELAGREDYLNRRAHILLY